MAENRIEMEGGTGGKFAPFAGSTEEDLSIGLEFMLADSFRDLKEQLSGLTQFQIEELKKVAEQNENNHKDFMKQIKDRKLGFEDVTKENMRYSLIQDDVNKKMAEFNSQGFSLGAYWKELVGVFNTILPGISKVLEGPVGALAGLGLIVGELRKANEELLKIQRGYYEVFLQVKDYNQINAGTGMGEAYTVARKYARLGITEDQTNKIAGVLVSQAGLEGAVNLDRVMGISTQHGMTPEAGANYIAAMRRGMNVPQEELVPEFYRVTEAGKKSMAGGGLTTPDFLSAVSQLQGSTRQLGYSFDDSINTVRNFSNELRNGVLTVQDLVAVRTSIAGADIGQRAFVAGALLQGTHIGNVISREADQFGGGAIGRAEALRGILQGGSLYDPINNRIEAVGGNSTEARRSIMAQLQARASGMGEGAGRLFMNEQFGAMTGIDLMSKTAEQADAIVRAFKTGGIVKAHDVMEAQSVEGKQLTTLDKIEQNTKDTVNMLEKTAPLMTPFWEWTKDMKREFVMGVRLGLSPQSFMDNPAALEVIESTLRNYRRFGINTEENVKRELESGYGLPRGTLADIKFSGFTDLDTTTAGLQIRVGDLIINQGGKMTDEDALAQAVQELSKLILQKGKEYAHRKKVSTLRGGK